MTWFDSENQRAKVKVDMAKAPTSMLWRRSPSIFYSFYLKLYYYVMLQKIRVQQRVSVGVRVQETARNV